jgi:DNA-binding NarL/FixJ family response regulator
MSQLTQRQLDVLRLRAEGRSYREICEALGWSSTNAVHEVMMQLRALNCVHGRPREPVVSAEGIARLEEAGVGEDRRSRMED